MATVLPPQSAAAEAISVEMAQIRVSTRLTDSLVAYGLGACVAVCAYDPTLRVAGMAHVVLPESSALLANSKGRADLSVGKFADTAVPALIDELCKNGGRRDNIRAVVAGGAHIFGQMGTSSASRLEIGERNSQAVSAALAELGIGIDATDIGGSHGRTVTLKVCDGSVRVRPIGREEAVLATLSRAGELKEP